LNLKLSYVVLASAALVGQACATVIDTTGSWNGSSSVFFFGYPDTATYGQTVKVSGDNVLNSFTFFMKQPASLTFSGHVYAWDGAKASGSAIWSSGPMSTAGTGTFEAVTFNTGNLNLTSGNDYVLFATVTGHGGSGLGEWGFMSSNVYNDGLFVFLNNGQSPDWTTSNWSQNWQGTSSDLAFIARFSDGGTVIPGPAAALTMLIPMVARFARRRK
jgi:hypothetical protein